MPTELIDGALVECREVAGLTTEEWLVWVLWECSKRYPLDDIWQLTPSPSPGDYKSLKMLPNTL